MFRHATTVRVRYADTDQMRIVYNGKYFEYFEVGRTELMRSIGLPYAELERRGVMMPLVECNARFRLPARYDEELEIIATVSAEPQSKIHIDYEIKRGKELLVEGFTTLAFVDYASGRPMRAPDFFLEALRSGRNEKTS